MGAARMVAVSADPRLVGDFATRLLGQALGSEEDPVVASIEEGRRRALRIVADERA